MMLCRRALNSSSALPFSRLHARCFASSTAEVTAGPSVTEPPPAASPETASAASKFVSLASSTQATGVLARAHVCSALVGAHGSGLASSRGAAAARARNTSASAPLLVRDAVNPLIARAVAARTASGGSPLVFDGPQGSGKSVALAFAAAQAEHEKWLMLSVPNVRELVKAPDSWTREGDRFLQHDDALRLLRHWVPELQRANPIPLPVALTDAESAAIVKRRRDSDKKRLLATLTDVAELGAVHRDNALAAVLALCRLLPLVKQQPVGIVMDGVNYLLPEVLSGATSFPPPVRPVPASQLPLVMGLRSLLTTPLRRGSVLAATSYTAKDLPKTLPSLKQSFPGAQIVRIGSFTQKESLSLLDKFAEQGLIDPSHASSEADRRRLVLLSAGSPAELVRLCIPL